MRVNLAHNEDFISPAFDGFTNQCFRAAFPVHLGGIDQRQAQVDPASQAVDFLLAADRVVADAPRALAEGRNDFTAGKRRMFHSNSITGPASSDVLHHRGIQT
jgi:hypothetical protein